MPLRAWFHHLECQPRLWLLVAGMMTAGSGGASASDRFVVDVWTPDDGLPQSLVSSIAQTPDGYLWIGAAAALGRAVAVAKRPWRPPGYPLKNYSSRSIAGHQKFVQ